LFALVTLLVFASGGMELLFA